MNYYERLVWIAKEIELKDSCFVLTESESLDAIATEVKAMVVDLGLKPLVLKYSEFQVSKNPKSLMDFRDDPSSEWVIIVILDQPFSDYGYSFLKLIGDELTRKMYGGIDLPNGVFLPIKNATMRCGVVVTTKNTILQCSEDDQGVLDYYSVL